VAPQSAKKPLYRADVAERLVRLLRRISGVRVGTAITGRPTFYAGDKVFAFVNRDGVVVKLPEETIRTLRGDHGVGPFVMKGRPKMKEWVVIRRDDPAAYDADLPLFREAAAFAATGKSRPTARRTPPGRRYERGPMSREAKP
jgi:hypothetical protein